MQALFCAPPQHIIGLHGPLLAHQVAHFCAGQIGAKIRSKIVELACRLQNCLNAAAVGFGQPLRMGVR